MTGVVSPLGVQTRRERSGKDLNPNADLLRLQQDVVSAGACRHPRGLLLQTCLFFSTVCVGPKASQPGSWLLLGPMPLCAMTTSSNILSSRGERGRDLAGPTAGSARSSFVAHRSHRAGPGHASAHPCPSQQRDMRLGDTAPSHWPGSTVTSFFQTESRFRSWRPSTH